MKRFLKSNISIILIFIVGMLFFVGAECEKTKQPITSPIYGLDIDLYNHAPEALVNENVYIRGEVRDGLGALQSGIKVYFTVTPDTVGIITPWAITDTNSQTGFNTMVTFQGKKGGVALIRGSVRNEAGGITSSDTVSVLVRSPINQ